MSSVLRFDVPAPGKPAGATPLLLALVLPGGAGGFAGRRRCCTR